VRAGASLTQSRGLPSRLLFGSAYMCGRPRCLPSVRVLVWMCTHDQWSRRRSMASLVRCSGRAAGRVESGERGPSNQSQVLWLPDMSGALPTTVRSASRFTILNAAEIPYGSCVTPLHDRRGAGAVSGTASGPRRGHQLWHADARHRASSRMQGSDLGWTAFTGLLRAPVRACIAWVARRTWPTAPTPRG